MTAYLIRRAIQMVFIVIAATIIIYGLLAFAPGGPLSGLSMATGNNKVSQSDIDRIEGLMGLDKPWYLQYLTWLVGDDWMANVPAWRDAYKISGRKGILRLDFGASWKIAQQQPVIELIAERLPNTLYLMVLSTILALMISIPAGIYSAVNQYSRFDYALTTFTFFGISMPVFWFGLIIIMIFSMQFQKAGIPYLPSGDIVSIRIDPNSVLGVLGATPNGLIPIITIVVYQIPSIFTGAIVTETVFNYKAIGYMYIMALNQDDWPVVMALLFINAILVVAATLLADVLYTVVDPRIRYS
ncbi:MAG: hypothetical protein B6242_06420 [Anaerolineaceae bacterium 4572_78]|nr:MAG: hypothetical protein B6242_06420 [Anaerolineaceae bacterium 4572_78]